MLRGAVAQVSPSTFRVLGKQVPAGQPFSNLSPAELADAAIVSQSFVRKAFDPSHAVLGATVAINDIPYRVVGIAGADFELPVAGYADLFLPLLENRGGAVHLNDASLVSVGRLRPGISRTAAAEELQGIERSIEASDPHPGRLTVRAKGLRSAILTDRLPRMLLMLTAAALLFVIGCGNTGTLILTRTLERAYSVSIRQALGASLGRLFADLCVEHAFLAGISAAVTAALYGFLISALLDKTALSSSLGLAGMPLMPGPLELAAVAVALFCATLAASLWPFWQVTHANALEMLRNGARVTSRKNLLKRAVLTVQVAAIIVLANGALLLVSTMQHLSRVGLGFKPSNLVSFRYRLPRAAAAKGSEFAFYQSLVASLSNWPAASCSAAVDSLPFASYLSTVQVSTSDEKRELRAGVVRISPSFPACLGIPLVAGRALTDADKISDGRVAALINVSLAAKLFGHEAVVGKTLAVRLPKTDPAARSGPMDAEIVGVLADVIQNSPDEIHHPEIYLPIGPGVASGLFVASRLDRRDDHVEQRLKEIVRQTDASAAVFNIESMPDRIEDSIGPRRLMMIISVLVSVIALAFAAIGLYALLTMEVQQARTEIGLRIALGASQTSVIKATVGRIGSLIVIGLVAGEALYAFLIRHFESVLYTVPHKSVGVLFGVHTLDPLLLGSVLLGTLAILSLAALRPAIQASHVDPMTVLRQAT